MNKIPYRIIKEYEEQIPDYDDDVKYIEPYEPTEEEITEWMDRKWINQNT